MTDSETDFDPVDDLPLRMQQHESAYRTWLVAQLVAFTALTVALCRASYHSGWGALGIAILVGPVTFMVLGVAFAIAYRVKLYERGEGKGWLWPPVIASVIAECVTFAFAMSFSGGGC